MPRVVHLQRPIMEGDIKVRSITEFLRPERVKKVGDPSFIQEKVAFVVAESKVSLFLSVRALLQSQ